MKNSNNTLENRTRVRCVKYIIKNIFKWTFLSADSRLKILLASDKVEYIFCTDPWIMYGPSCFFLCSCALFPIGKVQVNFTPKQAMMSRVLSTWALYLQESGSSPIVQEAGWPQGPTWWVGKTSLPLGLDPLAFQHEASCCDLYAIPARLFSQR